MLIDHASIQMAQIGLLCHARETRLLAYICMHFTKLTFQWFSRFAFDCWRTRKTSNPFVVLLIKSSKNRKLPKSRRPNGL